AGHSFPGFLVSLVAAVPTRVELRPPRSPGSNSGPHAGRARLAPTQAVLAWPPRRPGSPGRYASRAPLAPMQASLEWRPRIPCRIASAWRDPRSAAGRLGKPLPTCDRRVGTWSDVNVSIRVDSRHTAASGVAASVSV